jgi:hypothetical protein
MRTLTFIAFGTLVLGGCASTPGAKPQDMSAVQHEQAAAAHEAEATPHAEQYNPAAAEKKPLCPTKGPCWTSIVNPTKQHQEDAEKHHKMAADHRAAGQALRDAETRSCSGVSQDDRDMSPFYHREDISDVRPAYKASTRGKQGVPDILTGAVITVRAVPGLTAEWLQTIVDCHVARNNALGNEMSEMAYCPLNIKGITAKVTSAGNGFAVTIESQNSDSAKEILKRAQALKSSG